jgi:hypothetical protein
MSRELIEFSAQIDERFEPCITESEELWLMIMSWFAPQPPKEPHLNPLQRRGLDESFTCQAS